MLHTSIATYVPRVPHASGVSSSLHTLAGTHVAVRRERWLEAAVDDALADSFPVSDPPAWNPGVARPIPADGVRSWAAIKGPRARKTALTGTSWVIDVSGGTRSERTFAQMLVSLAGAAGLALAAPLVTLLVGLPFALAVRGLLEVFHRVSTAFPLMRRFPTAWRSRVIEWQVL